MSRNKALAVYLLGTFSQLLLVCLVVFFCNYYAVHSDLINVFGVMIGGISTALWGSIVAIWYYEIDLKKISLLYSLEGELYSLSGIFLF